MQLLALWLPRMLHFAAPAGCAKSFLGLETWFAYFPNNWFGVASTGGRPCDINNNFQLLPTNGQSGLLLIGLAVLDDLLRIAALVAVGYVIYGGFTYTTSNGSPDGTKQAQQTIINALVGLALAVTATAVVAFIGNKLSTG
jgi:type IV secretion system pilin